MSLESRLQIFIDLNVFVPSSVRCCLNHLNDQGYLHNQHYNVIRFVRRPYKLKGNEISKYLQAMREIINNNKKKRDFSDINDYTEEEFNIVSPVTKLQFNELLQYCDPVEYSGSMRNISRKFLITFLFKMRLGMSDDVLSIIFGFSSREYVSIVISLVRRSLTSRFVLENIGFNAMSRENFIARQVPAFHNELYNPTPTDPKAIVIVDATYSYIHKSRNFQTLRQSFSQHKSKHLIKPMVIVAPNGYILHIQGPYFSDHWNNDASIIMDIFNKNQDNIAQFFEPGDIFLIDRGFRDSIDFLQNRGYVCKMPPFLKNGQKHFNTTEANEARLITKSRCIVESRNGHFQTIFHFFRHVVPFAHILNLQDYYLIAGAIISSGRRPAVDL